MIIIDADVRDTDRHTPDHQVGDVGVARLLLHDQQADVNRELLHETPARARAATSLADLQDQPLLGVGEPREGGRREERGHRPPPRLSVPVPE